MRVVEEGREELYEFWLTVEDDAGEAVAYVALPNADLDLEDTGRWAPEDIARWKAQQEKARRFAERIAALGEIG